MQSWVPVTVVGVRSSQDDDALLLLLHEPERDLVVPIVIGRPEAAAIASAQAGLTPPRPMTHDLLVALLAAAGASVSAVRVAALRGSTFHAHVVLADGQVVDARASDAIAIAVRLHCPVQCATDVLTAAGLPVEHPAPEDDLEQFRRFLDEVTPDDFVGDDPS